MSRFVGALAVAALWCCNNSGASRAAQVPGANEILGEWEFTVGTFGEEHVWRWILQVTGNRITGQVGQMSVEGDWHGNAVEFHLRFPNGKIFGNFTGQVQPSGMTGEGRIADGPATWRARRPRTRPPGEPRLHDFHPQKYYRVFSSAIPPRSADFPR